MPNLLNENRNLREEINELQSVRGEAERRRRIRQLAEERTEGQPEESHSVVVVAGFTGTNEGCHSSPERWGQSNEELLEETRHRLAVLEETKEQFLHSSRTALQEGTCEEVGKEVRPIEDIGAQGSFGATLHSGQINLSRPTSNRSATRSSGNQKARSTMSQKQKLPKFTGNGKEDPVRHCRTCETIWTTNSVTDADEWLHQFPASLWGVVVDWFSNMDKAKIATWDDLKKEFQAEFQPLRNENEVVAKIYNCKKGRTLFEPTIKGSKTLAEWYSTHR